MTTVQRVLRLDYPQEAEIFGNRSTNAALPDYVWRLGRGANCPYCSAPLDNLSIDRRTFAYDTIVVRHDQCPQCGWWRKYWHPNKFSIGETLIGILQATDPVARDAAITSLGEAVLTRDGEPVDLPPTEFEQRVGDVLAEAYGCESVHTGRSGDGGIDLLLFDGEAGPIAVQVKRRQNTGRAEGVEVVRELRGAMVLAAIDRGMIVTSAERFTRGAHAAAVPAEEHLVPQQIELVDARRLLAVLDVIRVASDSVPSNPWWEDPRWPALRPDAPPPRPLVTVGDRYLDNIRRLDYLGQFDEEPGR